MGRRAQRRARAGTRAKVLGTVLAVGGAAAVAGLGTFGTFTSTTSAQTPTYASGTVVLDFGSGGVTNRLSVGASDLAPGDTAQRGFQLRNNGSLDMSGVTMSMTAPTSSLLDTDATNGLEVLVEKCSVAWAEVGTSAPFTYTCAGTTSTVLTYTPVATVKSTPQTLSNLTVTAGGTNNLRATFRLPSAAGNSVQGLSSQLSVTFTGTQRAAGDK